MPAPTTATPRRPRGARLEAVGEDVQVLGDANRNHRAGIMAGITRA